MSYHDATLLTRDAASAGVSGPPADSAAALPFSDLERRVLWLAQREPLSSARAPGRIGRALGWFFDIRRATPLADARLEALRRFAVVARRAGRRVVEQERARFIANGFSPVHADLVARTVASCA